MRPSTRAVLEVGHFPIPIDRFISNTGQQAPKGRSQSGHHRVLCGAGFESFKDRIEPEASVRPEAQFADIRRHVGEAGVQQFNTTLPSSCVAWTKLGIPEVRGVGLNAQQRVGGALPAVAWVVTDGCLLLASEHRDYRAVQVQNQS